MYSQVYTGREGRGQFTVWDTQVEGCSGCRKKADEWGQPPLNVLFCTRTDGNHEKQSLAVIVEAAEQLVGGWDMKTKTELVGVSYPAAGSMFRAHEPLDPVLALEPVGACSSCVPSFDTRTGEEICVPAPCVVPEPGEHPTYILQWIRIGSSELIVFFDRGASLNLIQGSIAEKEGLQTKYVP